LDSLSQSAGWTFGIPAIDQIVVPVQPGELVVFQGETGQGKTSMLTWCALREAHRIKHREVEEKEDRNVVVFATIEESVERMEMRFIAAGELTTSQIIRGEVPSHRLAELLRNRLHLPLYTIGHSFKRRGPRRARLTLDTIRVALQELWEEQEARPTLLCLDYIQVIPVDKKHSRSRPEELSWLAQEVVAVAQEFSMATFVAAQAKGGSSWALPGVLGAQWSSGIAQAADKVFSLSQPSRWDSFLSGEKTTVSVAGKIWPITEKLFLLGLRKQRDGPSPAVWVMHFDLGLLTLEMLDEYPLESTQRGLSGV
jgi:replicative DNA helicase